MLQRFESVSLCSALRLSADSPLTSNSVHTHEFIYPSTGTLSYGSNWSSLELPAPRRHIFYSLPSNILLIAVRFIYLSSLTALHYALNPE